MAFDLADRGSFDDAIALAALNAESHPGDAEARQAWQQLRLSRTTRASLIR